jgi:hypothetical protein
VARDLAVVTRGASPGVLEAGGRTSSRSAAGQARAIEMGSIRGGALWRRLGIHRVEREDPVLDEGTGWGEKIASRGVQDLVGATHVHAMETGGSSRPILRVFPSIFH